MRLSGGAINLLGRAIHNGDAAAAHDARMQLGIVPQDLALYPLLTAAENMMAFGSLHGVPRAELKDRVKWVLDWTGLGERAKSLTRTFSGGMKRRLNIACGILHRPKVVLLDEPTVGVDPQSRERIWSMLAQLRDEALRCCSPRINSMKPSRSANASPSSITARPSLTARWMNW